VTSKRHEIIHLRPSKRAVERARQAHRASRRADVNDVALQRKAILIEDAFLIYFHKLRKFEAGKLKKKPKMDSLLKPFRDYKLPRANHFSNDVKKMIKDLHASQREDRGLKPLGTPIGPPRSFKLFPLSKKEERLILEKRRWRTLRFTNHGDYEVAPERYSIQNFQRKFWMARASRSMIVQIAHGGNLENRVSDLLFLRANTLEYLGNGTRELTVLQRKILSSVHFSLRHNKEPDHWSQTKLFQHSRL